MARLTAPFKNLAFFLDQEPKAADFRADVLEGLAQSPKVLPPKHFYDARGSALFEAICETPEYYVTRTELALMRAKAGEMAAALGPDAAIIEYGSGASEKVALLLDAMERPAAYVAIDISREALLPATMRVAEERPGLPVGAVCADFFDEIALPAEHLPGARRVGYFPGSTLGNFAPEEAVAFLERARAALGPDGEFLIGVDLEKDLDILLPAYDDAAGVTADFNRNVLMRMRSELGADVDPDDFEHEVRWNDARKRLEMHLKARKTLQIALEARVFALDAGETIHTENSHKFTLDRLGDIAAKAGWRIALSWTDPKGWFAVAHLKQG